MDVLMLINVMYLLQFLYSGFVLAFLDILSRLCIFP